MTVRDPAGDDAAQRRGRALSVAVFFDRVVVPAVIWATLTAFAFFLIDVRSAFLPGGERLRSIAFWFVLATVLISHLARTIQVGERAPFYTAVLGVAVSVAVAEHVLRAGGGGLLVRRGLIALNLLIFGAIGWAMWRLTSAMRGAFEVEEGGRTFVQSVPLGDGGYLHRTIAFRDEPEISDAEPIDPASELLRVGVIMVAVAALGGMLLRGRAPELVDAALVHSIVFTGGLGVLVSSASTIRALRELRGPRALLSPWVLPARVVGSFLLVILACGFAYAVTAPFLSAEGTQSPEQAALEDNGRGSQSDHRDHPSADEPEAGARGEEGVHESAEGDRRGNEGGTRERAAGHSSTSGGAAAAIARVASVLAGIVAVALALYLVVRLLRTGWRPRRPSGAQEESPVGASDSRSPRSLDALSPELAVIEAFERLEDLAESLDKPRAAEETPAELATRLARSHPLAGEALRRIARRYTELAYGGIAPQRAVVEELRGALVQVDDARRARGRQADRKTGDG